MIATAKRKRKLTKAEARREQLKPENRKRLTGAFLRAMTHRLAKEKGDPMFCTLGESIAMVIGVPLPSFCLEYLLQQTVWPLSRLVMIVGIEGTAKSGLCFEISRWFRQFMSGVNVVLEHESKFSGDWACSFLGWDDPSALAHYPCDSINECQSTFLQVVHDAKVEMKGTKTNPGTGKTWPLHIVIDSIMGKATKETQARIDKAGYADRNFPDEARAITSFLRKVPQDIRRWPFSLTMVNHLKPSRDQHTGLPIRGKPGGAGLNFQETFELQLDKRGKINRAKCDGMTNQITCYKNSLGVTHRSIKVDLTWADQLARSEEQEENERWLQRSRWHWHAASIQLYFSLDADKKTKGKAAEWRKIVDLNKVKGNQIWSKKLGIPPKKPVSFDKAGKIMCENAEVLRRLRTLFGIKIRPVFDIEVDYEEQIKAEKRRLNALLKAGKLKLVDVVEQIEPVPDEAVVEAKLREAAGASATAAKPSKRRRR